MKYKKCNKCGAANEDLRQVCRKCGTALPYTVLEGDFSSLDEIERAAIGGAAPAGGAAQPTSTGRVYFPAENTIAKVISLIAKINLVCGGIIAFVLLVISEEAALIGAALVCLITSIITSIFMFGFAEIIQLLSNIERNTRIS